MMSYCAAYFSGKLRCSLNIKNKQINKTKQNKNKNEGIEGGRIYMNRRMNKWEIIRNEQMNDGMNNSQTLNELLSITTNITILLDLYDNSLFLLFLTQY